MGFGPKARSRALAGLCYAGMFYTHSLMSWLSTLLLALLLLGLWCLRLTKLVDLLRLGTFFVLGVAAAAMYWLPALAEQSAIQINRARNGTWDFHVNFVPLARTLSLEWAHQFQGYVGVNGPAQLGLAQTTVAAAGLATVLVLTLTGRLSSQPIRLAILMAVLSLIFFLLMLSVAAPFWERVPFGQYLQFPDRMLAPLAFTLALLSGGLGLTLRKLPDAAGLALAASAAALLIYGGVAQLHVDHLALPDHLGPDEAVEYEQMTGASGSALGEFAPVAVGPPPVSSPLVLSYLTGQPQNRVLSTSGAVSQLRGTAADVRFHASSASPGSTTLLTAYYPGWTAVVNGREVPITPDESGLISFPLPAGEADVDVQFRSTPDRQGGELASATGLLALLSLLLGSLWRKKAPAPLDDDVALGRRIEAQAKWRAQDTACRKSVGQASSPVRAARPARTSGRNLRFRTGEDACPTGDLGGFLRHAARCAPTKNAGRNITNSYSQALRLAPICGESTAASHWHPVDGRGLPGSHCPCCDSVRRFRTATP